ncbi:MAG TPA: MBL fold metallo-hydrolase [Lachnospiraceae bacterium]|nr:MBL fold metallo-hydrolase [Lachnospiraceae bacterium]
MKFMYFFDNNLKRYVMYGKRMLHPQETGKYEAGISCIREDDVNIWFYTKNNKTIAIDAGHLDFKGINKEFKKIDIDGKKIGHVLLTHSDVDHCGGVDRSAKNYIFPNAKVYIGKGEENYFGGAVCRMIKAGIPLKNPVRLRKGYRTVTDGEIFDLDGIKVQVIDVPGHTIGHVCYIVDDKILFSGDCLAINSEGGYSLFDFFTQNPELNKKSLRNLKSIIEKSSVEYVCTGHSGIHRLNEKTFAHIDKSAKSSLRKPFDPTAPKSIVS